MDYPIARYDEYGRIIFEKGGDNMQPNEEGLSRPTIDEVKARFGEDTAELYARALEREFTLDDLSFAEVSSEWNTALKSFWGWRTDNLTGSAEYFVREIALEYGEQNEK